MGVFTFPVPNPLKGRVLTNEHQEIKLMLFHSQYFLIFLSAVFVITWTSGRRKSRQWILLGASLIFYSFWSIPLVSLLIISSVIDFYCGKRVAETKERRWVWLSLITNLGILGYFKYANFGIEAFANVAGSLGINISVPTLEVVLPLGISFYTFQSMSYTLDMYRAKYPPCKSFSQFALYVTFFPQLIAGPIVRANEFLQQLAKPRRLRLVFVYQGLTLFIIGIFKKIVLADQAGVFANAVFDSPNEYTSLLALTGVFAFSFQIYFDFSAYTDMARGLGYLFGYRLPINFDRPYCALGIRDFWRRWHMSLSRWLRDYLYFSLGGSRKGGTRTVANVMLTMLLGGLWHGVSWNFVIWGGIHGVLISVENLLFGKQGRRKYGQVQKICLGLGTFILVSFSWIVFRAESFDQAKLMITAICTIPTDSFFHQVMYFGLQNWLLGIVFPSVILITSAVKPIDKTLKSYPQIVGIVGILGILIISMLVGGGANEFIYFQF